MLIIISGFNQLLGVLITFLQNLLTINNSYPKKTIANNFSQLLLNNSNT